MIKYIAITTLAFFLNGCVYYVQPEKTKEKPLEIIQDDSGPTSYSYPLPGRPKNIENYVSSEPYPIDNDQLNVEQQQSDSQDDETIQGNNSDLNQPRDSTGGDSVQIQEPQGANPESGAPVGSYNNPVSFDQNKVY